MKNGVIKNNSEINKETFLLLRKSGQESEGMLIIAQIANILESHNIKVFDFEKGYNYVSASDQRGVAFRDIAIYARETENSNLLKAIVGLNSVKSFSSVLNYEKNYGQHIEVHMPLQKIQDIALGTEPSIDGYRGQLNFKKEILIRTKIRIELYKAIQR